MPNQCSTPPSTSTEIYLRVVSEGTSYCRSRLAFHPYAQVIRTICTSVPVRSSTSLSKGFNLPKHRSTGFGYPTNDLRRAHRVPRACALRTFRFRFGFMFLTFNLAIDRNSMGRFSKRTIQRCSTLTSFVAYTPYQAITTWFQALCTSRQGYFSTFTQATSALSVSRSI